MTTVNETPNDILARLIVRKDHLLCTRCGAMDPVHPGDGTPALTFITALELAVQRHRFCWNRSAKDKSEKR